MCSNDWEAINFNHVPSMAMKIHGRPSKAFQRHQGERFATYKTGLAKGQTKVNAKALFPHQIAEQYISYRTGGVLDPLVEAQWKVMLEKGNELGDLSNVLVMSDVSGSMSGTPMNISISLGILISQLTSEAWKGLVMTFEAKPKFHKVGGESLFEQVNCLSRAPWGGNTDFIAALQLILDTARHSHIAQADMPKRLIVISDMQFDSAAGSGSKTTYTILQNRFTTYGYTIPHVVFWNVNGAIGDFAAKASMPNVSLVSGYSIDVLKAVLSGTEITPESTMLAAINDERYSKITL